MGSEDPEGCTSLPWHQRASVLKKYGDTRDRTILCLNGLGTHENIWLLGRWKVPVTSLDMTAINSFGITHIDSQRFHLSYYCFLFTLRNGQMRASLYWHTSLGLKSYSLQLLGCWARESGCGNLLVPFGQGWAHRHRQFWLSHSPLKKVIWAFCH